ncbi:MAG: phosphoadenylyl-sulfate reductase [Chloroflexi bacterium]|nr:phosphoadenylyl-sulfate reductase [Chloroflexota bacterium]
MDGLKIGDQTDMALPDAKVWDAERVIEWTAGRFGHGAALCTSFQADGMVILDMATRLGFDLRVFTIDTGRLHPETYDLIDLVRERYRIQIEVYSPDQDELNKFTTAFGVNAFYNSVSSRITCCDIRKVRPLNKILSGLDAWITGVRKDQSQTRANIDKLEIDDAHGGIVKVNPLADWNDSQVWDYIRENDVPYSALYNQGYTSIGCAPCTRPLEPGEDSRAGRWWWEVDVDKECGIHFSPETGTFGRGKR